MRLSAFAALVFYGVTVGIFPAAELRAQRASSGYVASPNQIVLEVGSLSGGVSYARRVAHTPLSIGTGLWGAWETSHTFDRNVFQPIGGLVFARLTPSPWLHGDLGPAVLNYYWADDCNECTGTFVGLRVAWRVGYRFVFVGPDVWVGSVTDGRNGSDFGAITHFQLRFVIGWGR